MFGIMFDWRFARHFDFYAGVAYSQRNGGLASGFATSNNNTAGLTNAAGVCPTCKTTVSTYDPGVGLRYQF
jgi:hypothetical protein